MVRKLQHSCKERESAAIALQQLFIIIKALMFPVPKNTETSKRQHQKSKKSESQIGFSKEEDPSYNYKGRKAKTTPHY